ncbi:hypothetical protein ACLB2K_026154 [Fragaria x ananassa]
MRFNHKRIQIRFRSKKQDQYEKRENTDLKKEQGESSEIRAAGGCGGDEWMRALESVSHAWMGSGGVRRWRSSGGGGPALVGFGNCGCEFKDCGLRETMPSECADQSEGDNKPFVEVDPTHRYGSYDELLVSGAVKKVYRAFDQEEGIEVAWNQVKLRNFINDSAMTERLYSEVRLLKSLKYKNIIALHNVWRDEEKNTLNFMTEVCTGGNLRDTGRSTRTFR